MILTFYSTKAWGEALDPTGSSGVSLAISSSFLTLSTYCLKIETKRILS